MGACAATGEETLRDRELGKELKRAYDAQDHVHKLLLLGAGGSGKSTLFKQSNYIYGPGFTELELSTYTPAIYANTIMSMQTLIEQSEYRASGRCESKLYEGLEPEDFKIDDSLKDMKKAVMESRRDGDGVFQLPVKLASYIRMLWKDKGIRNTYRCSAEYQLNDSASYFFERVEDLAVEGYIPKEEHVLRARVRSTGVNEIHFTIENTQFRMVDVGGQRSERKKWIKCFENVTCVLFVAAISSYNQTLYEDEDTNRMIEALNLFEETCNSKWFEKTSIILFLNKRDLFFEKVQQQHIPITVCPAFADYEGPEDSYEHSVEHIVRVFVRSNHTMKTIYPHATCAIDRNNVNAVFLAVKDTVLKENLKIAGIFDEQ